MSPTTTVDIIIADASLVLVAQERVAKAREYYDRLIAPTEPLRLIVADCEKAIRDEYYGYAIKRVDEFFLWLKRHKVAQRLGDIPDHIQDYGEDAPWLMIDINEAMEVQDFRRAHYLTDRLLEKVKLYRLVTPKAQPRGIKPDKKAKREAVDRRREAVLASLR